MSFPNQQLRSKDCIHPYQPLTSPRSPSQWITCSSYHSQKHGNDYVFVVIDWFSKMVILTACMKNIMVEAMTKIFFECVWVHLRLPQTIISDWNRKFLSTFWSILWSLLDTKLTKSTSFHPQTDGQTEVANRMVMHILQMYKSKHPCTWDDSLSYLQHNYNKSIHNSTGHSPF
jgi:hypothetical protein